MPLTQEEIDLFQRRWQEDEQDSQLMELMQQKNRDLRSQLKQKDTALADLRSTIQLKDIEIQSLNNTIKQLSKNGGKKKTRRTKKH
jgi:hypothetical protein